MVYLAKGKYAFRDEALAIDFCKIYSRLVEIDSGYETRYFTSKVDVKRVKEGDVKHVYGSFEELEEKNPYLKLARLRNAKALLCARIRLPQGINVATQSKEKYLYVNYKTLKAFIKAFRDYIKERKIPKEEEKYLKLEIFPSKFRVCYDQNLDETLNQYEKLKELFSNCQSRIKSIDKKIETVKMDIEDEIDEIEE